MHEGGYAHRVMRPGNIMPLLRAIRWMVIDIGCIARVGENGPLACTLTYAAPAVGQPRMQEK